MLTGLVYAVTGIVNLSQLAKHFSDEAEAWKLVERLRWPDGMVRSVRTVAWWATGKRFYESSGDAIIISTAFDF